MKDKDIPEIMDDLKKLEEFVTQLPGVVDKEKIINPNNTSDLIGFLNKSKEGVDPMVVQPSHYTVGGIEALDMMEIKLTPREFIGAMKAQVLKYTMRASYKGKEKQDLEKADFYSKRLITYLNKLDELPPV